MAKDDLGRTIFDELKICYTATSTLLNEFTSIDIKEKKHFDKFTIKRTTSRQFDFAFEVLYSTEHRKIATIHYGHYSEQRHSSFVYYRVENEVLYKQDLFNITIQFPEFVGMAFHHFTAFDLAQDCKCNVTSIIRKTAKEDNVKVIINGKAIDKDKDIEDGMLIYTLNFKKLSNPTIVVKQAKAIKDKTKGLALCVYNKKKEIAKSKKNYINEFYESPKSLYRIEVHQNNEEIKDYCRLKGITQDISLIYNQAFLDDMYYYHLSALLRFTRGRKPLDWKEILHS